jgi:hypothetical protein
MIIFYKDYFWYCAYFIFIAALNYNISSNFINIIYYIQYTAISYHFMYNFILNIFIVMLMVIG